MNRQSYFLAESGHTSPTGLRYALRLNVNHVKRETPELETALAEQVPGDKEGHQEKPQQRADKDQKPG